jgi:hypothetical protein
MQISIPLGAFKIASVLRKNGFKTLVINHLSKFSLEELKDLLEITISNRTKLIGISNTFIKTTDYKNLSPNEILPQGKYAEEELFSFIKQKNNKVKIALGGAKTTPNFSNKNIDYVFMGFSEVSIINLLDHLSTDSLLTNSYKNIHGITIIDDRTAKSYNFCQDSMIWEKSDIVNHQVLPIEIGRGCIFKCKFCSYPLNGKKKLDYIKDSEIIHSELLANYLNFGIEHYFIVDDTFNDSVEKLEQIRKAVICLPFKPKFWCYARLDLICTNPEMLELMYDIGIRAFYFGIETLNEKTGRIIGKGYSRQKQIAMIKHIREKYPDVTMHGSFIMGLPEEPLTSINETIYQLENGLIQLNSWMMKPLFLREDTAIGFLSELDKNYKQYGYEHMGIQDKYIIWKNEHINFYKADQITTECINVSRSKDFFNIPGHDAFELVNYGFNFYDTIKTKFTEFRWGNVKDKIVPEFIEVYKKELLNSLKQEL